jgi:hypothetical protein
MSFFDENRLKEVRHTQQDFLKFRVLSTTESMHVLIRSMLNARRLFFLPIRPSERKGEDCPQRAAEVVIKG